MMTYEYDQTINGIKIHYELQYQYMVYAAIALFFILFSSFFVKQLAIKYV